MAAACNMVVLGSMTVAVVGIGFLAMLRRRRLATEMVQDGKAPELEVSTAIA